MAKQDAPTTTHSEDHPLQNSSEFVSTLAKGLGVIEAFDEDHPYLTLSEVAQRTGMSRAAARRFLLTLVALNYASKKGRYFTLGPGILNLGYAFLRSKGVNNIVMQFLQEITNHLQESCSIAMLEGADIIYIARSAAPHRLMSVSLDTGSHLPAYCTSFGRVLLSSKTDEQILAVLNQSNLKKFTPRTYIKKNDLLNKIHKAKQDGYAIVDQELEIGLRSIAVPIAAQSGLVKAAMNVSCNVTRTSLDDMKITILPLLQAYADKIAPLINDLDG